MVLLEGKASDSLSRRQTGYNRKCRTSTPWARITGKCQRKDCTCDPEIFARKEIEVTAVEVLIMWFSVCEFRGSESAFGLDSYAVMVSIYKKEFSP